MRYESFNAKNIMSCLVFLINSDIYLFDYEIKI